MNVTFFALSALALILVPFMPHLLRLRIRILRWIRWNWAANLLENHFAGWVLLFRVLLSVVAVVLFGAGWRELHG